VRTKEQNKSLQDEMLNTGYLHYRWYVRENDLIGGWCIMPIDEPPSYGISEVADFMSRECAEHIVKLHNAWLDLHPELERTANR
jgi:hypothetical protein